MFYHLLDTDLGSGLVCQVKLTGDGLMGLMGVELSTVTGKLIDLILRIISVFSLTSMAYGGLITAHTTTHFSVITVRNQAS